MDSRFPDWHCPEHALPLEVVGARLGCRRGHHYESASGIPRFVGERSYADAFGAQWLRFQRTQLDSYTGLPISRERIRRSLGDRLWSRLRGALVLEAGCGAGRFTDILLTEGADVLSVDLSAAVVANQLNFPQGSHHRIAQADLCKLPLPRGRFDLAICLGVLQHLPVPEVGIASLARQLRPGGALIVDHYNFKWSWWTRSAAPLRLGLRRLSARAGLRATDAIVSALLPLHERARWPIVRRLLTRLSPVVSYHHAYPDMPIAIRREWAFLDTHDSLTDHYKHFRGVRELAAAMQSAGLVDVRVEVHEGLVVGRGTRGDMRASSAALASELE